MASGGDYSEVIADVEAFRALYENKTSVVVADEDLDGFVQTVPFGDSDAEYRDAEVILYRRVNNYTCQVEIRSYYRVHRSVGFLTANSDSHFCSVTDKVLRECGFEPLPYIPKKQF